MFEAAGTYDGMFLAIDFSETLPFCSQLYLQNGTALNYHDIIFKATIFG